jgi:hypothetical protein
MDDWLQRDPGHRNRKLISEKILELTSDEFSEITPETTTDITSEVVPETTKRRL